MCGISMDDRSLRLDAALCQIPTIHEKHVVLESIALGCRHALRKASKDESLLDQWVQDRFAAALDTLDIVKEQDSRDLSSIGRKHSRDFFLHQ